jgi:hypothetical protein
VCSSDLDLARVLGLDVWRDTYMCRLGDQGVDSLVRWHSAYMWFACDFTFMGVPFLMLVLGYVYGLSWGISTRHQDITSQIVCIIVGNMLLFLFANNSYLSSMFYSLMFVFPIWCVTRLLAFKPHMPASIIPTLLPR